MSYARYCSPVFVLSIGAISVWGCGGPSARVRPAGEPDLVGDRRAGVEVYRNVIDQALKDLSGTYRDRSRGQAAFTRIRVAFFGVENATNEELGSWRDQINGIIVNRLDAAGDFQNVNFERFIKPALDRARVNPRDLVIPEDRRKLMAVLEQQNSPVDAFLFGRLTQGDTRAGNLKQSDYILFFDLMNPQDGTYLSAHGEISKEYAR